MVTNEYPRAFRFWITAGRASASRVEWSSGFDPQCMSTISPGRRLPSTRFSTVWAVIPPEVPSHPRVSTVQPTGTNPVAFTTEIVCWL
jgi:hypothetical protein